MSNRIKGLELESKDSVSQSIDIRDYIDGEIDESYAEAFAQKAVDVIVERTKAGKAPNGQSFAKYANSYTASKIFDAAGKSSKVNLTLSGELLGTLEVLDVSGSEVKIGWSDEKNNNKAFGHMTGMDGHPWLDGKTPVRAFFGLTESEAKAIVKEMGKPSGIVADADKLTLTNLFQAASIFRGLFR